MNKIKTAHKRERRIKGDSKDTTKKHLPFISKLYTLKRFSFLLSKYIHERG